MGQTPMCLWAQCPLPPTFVMASPPFLGVTALSPIQCHLQTPSLSPQWLPKWLMHDRSFFFYDVISVQNLTENIKPKWFLYSKLNCKGNVCVVLNTQIKCFYSSLRFTLASIVKELKFYVSPLCMLTLKHSFRILLYYKITLNLVKCWVLHMGQWRFWWSSILYIWTLRYF